MEGQQPHPPAPTPRTRPRPQTQVGGSEGEEETPMQKFDRLHRLAYTATEEAQTLDLEGSLEPAFKGYEKALQLIDSAIAVGSSGGAFSPEEQEAVEASTLKMRISRKEILERVSDLQHRPSTNSTLPPLENPHASHLTDLPPPYSEFAAALEEIANEAAAAPEPLPLHARELFSIASEVQIYFISAEDNVSAPTYPSFLRLVQLQQQLQQQESVPAFLQVGDWTYPLIPGHSPLFRSTEGIYIFPDLSQQSPGHYVGLILPECVNPEQRRAFEQCLLNLVGVEQFPPVLEPQAPQAAPLQSKEKPPRPAPPESRSPAAFTTPPGEEEGEEDVETGARRLSTKIAEGLITGAEAVSRGLIAGASKTSVFLDRGAAYLTSRMEPAGQGQHTVIKPEVRKGMKTAKTVTGKAVQVSGFIVTQVGRATVALGRHMAPHVHRASTRLLARTSLATDEPDAVAKVDQVLEVTAGAVVGFGTVYLGLENAARTLASSLANNTVVIVQHRYGEEAGEFATDTAATAGNAALAAWNTKNLAPKSVAKKVVKSTGKMVLKSHVDRHAENKQNGPDGPQNNS